MANCLEGFINGSSVCLERYLTKSTEAQVLQRQENLECITWMKTDKLLLS